MLTIIFIITGCSRQKEVSLNMEQIQLAFDRGIEYLRVKQNVDGSFKGYFFSYSNVNEKHQEDPLGYTVYSMYNIFDMQELETVKEIVSRSLAFIYSRGIIKNQYWYWKWRNRLPYDLDDTALSYLLLHQTYPEVKININSFPHDGYNYKTWYEAWYQNEDEPYDDIVNINVLSYMVNSGLDYQVKLAETLNKFVNNEINSYYYVHFDEAFLYYITKIKEILPSIPIEYIKPKVLKLVKKNSKKSTIKNVYLGSSLMRLNLFEEEVRKLLQEVLLAQNNDGSWGIENTFCALYKTKPGEHIGWGSKELTTSYAVHFLYSFLQKQK